MSIDKLALAFLTELHSDNVKGTFESLSNMLNELENKNDPEKIEVDIVEQIYQLIEKLNVISETLKVYVSENDVLLGDKIQSLIDKNMTLFE
jgi:predicted XRE-type DNA-binding protein